MWIFKEYNIEEISKSFTIKINTYGKEGRIIKETVSFAEDDWKTIIENVKIGNKSKYKVGDIKELTLGTRKSNYIYSDEVKDFISGIIPKTTYTVRIANKSTPEECSKEYFSETACDFVIELIDILNPSTFYCAFDNALNWPNSNVRE